MECSPWVSTTMVCVPWRGTAPKDCLCLEDSVLLQSISLFVALEGIICLLIYELYENSKGVFSPSLGNVIGVYNNNV